MSGTTDKLDAALAYADRGFAVFPLTWRSSAGACSCGKPCASPCKHPLTAHGLKAATTNAATIRQWWVRWPHANIGVATGRRLLVLDVDGDDAAESLRQLEREHGELPATASVRTGRPGGEHRWYRLPDGIVVRNASGKTLGTGIDVRGDGGYVCAPPSVHYTGVRYERLLGSPRGLADAPGWLIELLKRRDEPPAAKVSPSAPGPVSKRLRAAGEARLSTAVERLRALPREPDNARGDAFYSDSCWVGGAVGAGVIDHATALDALRDTAYSLGLPDSHQAWRSIENGLRDGAAKQMSEAELPDRSTAGTGAPGSSVSSRVVKFTLASAIRDEPVRWLWRGRVPLGAVTVLARAAGARQVHHHDRAGSEAHARRAGGRPRRQPGGGADRHA